MDLTPKQQTSEAIRQAETVLIITGQHPSVDQVSAVMALAAILRKFGKKVTPIVTDNPPASVQMLDMGAVDRGMGGSRDFVIKVDVTKGEVDKLRYEVQGNKLNISLTPFKGSFAPNDVTFGYGDFHYDLAIALGVPTRARLDRIYDQNLASFETIPLVNLDFHRSNESYGAVNLIEPNASSLCEMLVALSESLQGGIIDAEIATALFMGIIASTDRFTATHTSPKSLTVAAQMMAAGARHQAVIKALYRDGRGESRGERGGDRSTGGDRGSDRSSGNERGGDRSNGSDRGAQSQSAPTRSAGGATSPANQGSPAQAPARSAQLPAPVAPIVAPSPEPVPQMGELEAGELPIIEPSHIELSSPETTMASSPDLSGPVPDSATSVQPIPAVPHQEQSAPVRPSVELPVPSRPSGMPIADFAAAAEMFRRQPAADENGDTREPLQ